MSTCRQCNAPIGPRRVFCSRSCAATFNNAAHPKRTAANRASRCAQCGNGLRAHQVRFCCLACTGEHTSSMWAEAIERGEVSEPKTLKRYLARVRGHHCALCGAPPVHNGRPLTLQIDPIDGNSDHNLPANLRLLCPNCHSQTETFTSRQKKATRRNRYLQRYKSGTA